MKRNTTIRIVSILTIALFASSILIASVHAYTFQKSNKVAMVPSNICSNGGSLYVGSTWPKGDTFTFSNLAPATIADGGVPNPITAGGFDTVCLMSSNFNLATLWADADFSGRILSFVNAGGKLIIYDSESNNNYAGFVYPFTISSPGATGSTGGSVVNPVDDTLSSNNPADDSYINIAKLLQSDAVGDANVMTSQNPAWTIDMTCVNTLKTGGPVHTWALYGAGVIIYNGFDLDPSSMAPSNTDYRAVQNEVWWRELTGPANIGPGPSVSGLTLTPATATNPVGTLHTVTATVRDSIFNPVPGVVVTFTIISGPNAGLTGQDTTGANGEATFSWTSTVPGTDVVKASIPAPAGTTPTTITTNATKDWVPECVIPEVPIGAIMAAAGSFAALGVFVFTKQRRFHL